MRLAAAMRRIGALLQLRPLRLRRGLLLRRLRLSAMASVPLPLLPSLVPPLVASGYP